LALPSDEQDGPAATPSIERRAIYDRRIEFDRRRTELDGSRDAERRLDERRRLEERRASDAEHVLAGARVVIVHDFLESYGGAERITEVMAQAFPDAPVYTFMARADVARRMGIQGRCHTILPARDRLLRHYRLATPLLSLGAEAVSLPEADVVLSSSYAFAYHLHSRNRAPHVCFSHSPIRFAWTMTDHYRQRWTRGPATRLAFNAMAELVRRRDRRAAQKVTHFLAASPYTASQIERFYGRPATVVGAPVDGRRFLPAPRGPKGDYFLFCGRLVEPYKRVLATIEAFRHLPARLVIAGAGPAYADAKDRAGANVEFVGELDDAALVELMQHCRAAVFPSQDDFGLVALEVMACGRPVLAFDGGGAEYTIQPGVTGELFDDATPDGIATAVRAFSPGRYDPETIRRHALRWGAEPFRRRLLAAVSQVLTG
jgi:glycosyltransferase involved in cell wall biosynthesis